MSDCIVSTVGWNANGYRRTMAGYAHRLAMEAHLGRKLLPPKYESVDHECHNRDTSCPGGPECPHRACVNIEHLVVVPLTENWRKGRLGTPAQRRALTHCPQNHSYDEENLRASKDGFRRCKRCHAERERKRRDAGK